MTAELSLYRIDETLAQLIILREEMTQDDYPATEDELAVVDQQIREYLMVELPRKVAATCATFRKWKGERALNKAERDRLARLDHALEQREEWLKAYVAEILERQPMPAKGCRKLEGADGSKLMLKGNGGVQPLNVDAELLPSEYFDVMIRMPADDWDQFIRHPQANDPQGLLRSATVQAREPANGRIREALGRPCVVCRHEDGRPRLFMGFDRVPCTVCGGSGTGGVPGASLGERGSHVEIR